jgi:hypothetical protein
MLKDIRTPLLVMSALLMCNACAGNPPDYGPQRSSNGNGYAEHKKADKRYFLIYQDIDQERATAGFARRAKELCPNGYSAALQMYGTLIPNSPDGQINLDPFTPGTRSEKDGEITCK